MPFPSPGDLPDPGIEALSLLSPALAGGFFTTSTTWEASLVAQMLKNLPGMQETIPWSREWIPPPVFLPGELHGQRSLAGYSPWT